MNGLIQRLLIMFIPAIILFLPRNIPKMILVFLLGIGYCIFLIRKMKRTEIKELFNNSTKLVK